MGSTTLLRSFDDSFKVNIVDTVALSELLKDAQLQTIDPKVTRLSNVVAQVDHLNKTGAIDIWFEIDHEVPFLDRIIW